MKKIILFAKRKILQSLLKIKILFGIKTTTFTLKTGEKIRIRNIDQLGLELMVEDAFEPLTQQLVLERIERGMTVLDIGANIGFYTVKIANRVGPEGRVISFEPNPEMVDQLAANIKLNKLSNVTVQSIALSDGPGTIQFNCPEPGREGHGSFMPNHTFKTHKLINVQAERLDAVLEKLGITHVDFIKIDVEGAEKKIFAGASTLLSSNSKPVIIFECAEITCNSFGHRVYDVLTDVVNNGYTVDEFDYSNWIALPKEQTK